MQSRSGRTGSERRKSADTGKGKCSYCGSGIG